MASPAKNAPCPCGSGKKYKSCCLEKELDKVVARRSRKLILAAAIGIIVVACAIGSAVYISTRPGTYDDFAKCLTDKGFKMYGAAWCDHCSEQKSLFDKSFKYIDYTECANKDSSGINQLCKDKGVDRLPTWFKPDGTKVVGKKTMDELASMSSCPLPGTE